MIKEHLPVNFHGTLLEQDGALCVLYGGNTRHPPTHLNAEGPLRQTRQSPPLNLTEKLRLGRH
jgi:hypothetical protein